MKGKKVSPFSRALVAINKDIEDETTEVSLIGVCFFSVLPLKVGLPISRFHLETVKKIQTILLILSNFPFCLSKQSEDPVCRRCRLSQMPLAVRCGAVRGPTCPVGREDRTGVKCLTR